jgi:hypothetical protein
MGIKIKNTRAQLPKGMEFESEFLESVMVLARKHKHADGIYDPLDVRVDDDGIHIEWRA